ncbi:membrane protein [Microbacterium phage ValentiniPuff]|uniref:Membrane protein n=1 Tax=Microbacterium phage ValentiniPuff TaxID=2315705 RepID=A0A386KQU4_9CAUD|nr:membrane protein [Microbacterium phage ValentiniPuff]
MIVWNVDWILVLTFVVATVLPLLVAIVSTDQTNGKRKGILLAVLALVTSVLSGILDALVNGTEYDLGGNLVLLLGVFAWSVASYFGVWRGKGDDGQSVTDKLTSNVGRTVVVHESPRRSTDRE